MGTDHIDDPYIVTHTVSVFMGGAKLVFTEKAAPQLYFHADVPLLFFPGFNLCISLAKRMPTLASGCG